MAIIKTSTAKIMLLIPESAINLSADAWTSLTDLSSEDDQLYDFEQIVWMLERVSDPENEPNPKTVKEFAMLAQEMKALAKAKGLKAKQVAILPEERS